VALGIADLPLGTDTAGSGRVPAAFQGIVGVKPTRGLVPTIGVVPACRELDCVTVLARELEPAELAMSLMVGPATDDPLSRTWSSAAPIAAPPIPRIGVFGALPDLTPAAQDAFERPLRGGGARRNR
jgi:allophanate hydrolase